MSNQKCFEIIAFGRKVFKDQEAGLYYRCCSTDSDTDWSKPVATETEIQQAQTTPWKGYYLGPIMTTPRTERSEATFSTTMYPEKVTGFFRTGDDCFYVDQTGIIRHSGSPTVLADANSPPVR